MRKSLLLIAVLALCFAACKKNSDPDGPLTGTWNAYATRDSIYYKLNSTTEVRTETKTRFYQKYIFRSDGTCTLIDSTGTPGFVADLQYKVVGNQFILGSSGIYDTAAIAISGSQFNLTSVRDDADAYAQSVIYYRKE